MIGAQLRHVLRGKMHYDNPVEWVGASALSAGATDFTIRRRAASGIRSFRRQELGTCLPICTDFAS
jgi:hypothetical protein